MVLSERLRVVYGPAVILPTPSARENIVDEPLRIELLIELRRGAVSFDPWTFAVVLAEEGRTLSPISVVRRYPVRREAFDIRDRRAVEIVSETLVGPVTLREHSGWDVVRPRWHELVFTYDIARTELKPFAFRPGVLDLNGRTVHLPAVSFEQRSRLAPR